MASINSLPEFDPKKPQSWAAYAERLDFFLEASEIVDGKRKRAVLLSTCGNATYEIVRHICAPHKPNQKSYAEIIAMLSNHFAPMPSVIVQRFQFNKRDQKEEESFSVYIAELTKLAELCNFGAMSDDLLRDRVVCGIRDETLQRQLLTEKNLTLQMAKDAGIEAEKSASELSLTRRGYGKRQIDETDKPCFRCGGAHMPDDCYV